MILIEYPTPQIAKERMQALQSATLPAGPFAFKRSGPIVAAVNGRIPQAEALSLLASVNYDADVTWNEPAKLDPRENRIKFLYTVALLVVLLISIALVGGLAFGGARVFAKKLFPNRGFDRSEEIEIIRLNLK